MTTAVKESKVQKTANYEVKVHPQSDRLYHIELSKDAIQAFLDEVKAKDITVERLEYTPYERLIIAAILEEKAGEGFGDLLRSIVHDRETGGFTLGLEGVSKDTDEYVIFA